MIVIGVGYKARHGKDVFAQYLSKKYGFKILKFADALYWEVSNYLFAIDLRNRNGRIEVFDDNLRSTYIDYNNDVYDHIKNNGVRIGDVVIYSMRGKDGFMLQWWGTDIRRNRFSENYWVDKLLTNINSDGKYVISDVRFLNEVRAIKDIGGYLVKVQRFNEDGTLYVSGDRPQNHISEVQLDGFDGWDFVINAKSGELDKIFEGAERVYRELCLKS